VGALLKLK